MQDYQKLIARLVESGMSFVFIGGFAAITHGSSVMTEDLDICAAFDQENMERLLQALSQINPRHRLIGGERLVGETALQLSAFKNLYLNTDLGYIDILSEVSGIGGFDAVLSRSVEISLFGMPCCILDIGAVIDSKREMGRPKDQEAIVQLEAIQARRKS